MVAGHVSPGALSIQAPLMREIRSLNMKLEVEAGKSVSYANTNSQLLANGA